MRTDQQLLYFSLNKESVNSFYNYLDGSIWELKDSFRRAIKKEEALNFRHASDLMFFLDKQDSPESYYVIIDYLSFYNLQFQKKENNTNEICPIRKFERNKQMPVQNLEQFSIREAAKIIRRTILKYPEIMFLFDESWRGETKIEKGKTNFGSFLFYENAKVALDVNIRYHQYSVYDEDPFLAIRRNRSNLYDGSNLRYAIMRYMYDSLKVERYNFSIIQDSRKANLALVVEEELEQNHFNSFCLYVNGFRVIPILSSKELKYFNDLCDNSKTGEEDVRSVQLIVRDFDLQFDDVDDRSSNKISIKKSNIEEIEERIDIYEVDKIRRAKRGKNNYWYILEQKDNKTCQKDITLNWLADGKDFINEYWSNLRHIKTYYISKGPSNIQILKDGFFMEDKDSNQIIPGLHKPVCGIYESFRSLKNIRQTSDDALKYGKQEDDNTKNQKYLINTDRENHEHGVPLDIYDLVKSMVSRAKLYQKKHRYSLSAILALDAIEAMNGFHEQLMIQAYHVAATCENALAMSILGGNDKILKADATFRINKIKKDVDRLLSRDNNKDSRTDLKKNVLNQIFSDCRLFCKEKEHFEAEEAFISAMARLNDGVSFKNSSQQINYFFLKVKECCTHCWSNLKKAFHTLFAPNEDYICAVLPLLYDNYNRDSDYTKLKDDCWRLTGINLITISTAGCHIGSAESGKKWKSFDNTILFVDENGEITPIKNGLVLVSSTTDCGTNKYYLILVKKR